MVHVPAGLVLEKKTPDRTVLETADPRAGVNEVVAKRKLSVGSRTPAVQPAASHFTN